MRKKCNDAYKNYRMSVRSKIKTAFGLFRLKGRSDKRCSSAGRFCTSSAGAVTPLILLSLAISGICGLYGGNASAYELNMSISTDNLSIDMMPTDTDHGTFAKSSDASVSVTTDYNYGYTLNITAADSTNLKKGSDVIPSISSVISENDFKSSSSYDNQWGYSPSKYYSNGSVVNNTNRDFIPSPSTGGSIIDKTTAPNDTANTYAISIGAKANHDLASGSYVNTFVLTAVANSVPYVINYHANTTDAVTDLPTAQIGNTYETTINLSSTKPSRGSYGFYGWCTKPTTTVDGCASLGGTTYRAKAAYQLDPTSSNTVDLYAIWGTYSELDTGTNINIKMKSLASNTTITAANTLTEDIKAIRMADALPAGFTPTLANTISVIGSTHPATYIWYDNTDNAGIVYVYTTADKIRMNADSSHAFRSNVDLTDISGIAKWDTQAVTTLQAAFADSTALSNLNALANWDTSSNTMLYFTFGMNSNTLSAGYVPKLSDILGLANWDTSNVTDMYCLFQNQLSLTTLHGLENWDTSKVTTLQLAFAATGGREGRLSNISALSKWDTSSLTNMQAIFQSQTALTSLHGLENWDTSSVTNLRLAFGVATSTYEAGYRSQLSDISALASWDTSKVTTLKATFQYGTALNDISVLSNWDTSNVTTMELMFYRASISDLTPIAKWNTSKVTNMNDIFGGTPNLVDFSPIATTQRDGYKSWDTSNVTNMGWLISMGEADNTEHKVNNAVIDLTPFSTWNTSKVTAMYGAFKNLNIASFEPLANWNVSKVTRFDNTFYYDSSLAAPTVTSLTGLGSWNTSSATRMDNMFSGQRSLTDASAINGWNLTKVTNFTKMFNGVSTHPTFTNRIGTWDSNGTFVPSS